MHYISISDPEYALHSLRPEKKARESANGWGLYATKKNKGELIKKTAFLLIGSEIFIAFLAILVIMTNGIVIKVG